MKTCSTCVHSKMGRLEYATGTSQPKGYEMGKAIPVCFWNPDDLRIVMDDSGCGSFGWEEKP